MHVHAKAPYNSTVQASYRIDSSELVQIEFGKYVAIVGKNECSFRLSLSYVTHVRSKCKISEMHHDSSSNPRPILFKSFMIPRLSITKSIENHDRMFC